METQERTRFEVLLENIQTSVNVLAEGQIAIVHRLDRIEHRLDRIEVRLDNVELRLDVLESESTSSRPDSTSSRPGSTSSRRRSIGSKPSPPTRRIGSSGSKAICG